MPDYILSHALFLKSHALFFKFGRQHTVYALAMRTPDLHRLCNNPLDSTNMSLPPQAKTIFRLPYLPVVLGAANTAHCMHELE